MTRFSFRLRTLLVVVSVICGLLGFWWHHLARYRRQQKALLVLKETGVSVETRIASGPEWQRQVVGEKWFVEVTAVRSDRLQITDEQLMALPALLNVLEMSWIGSDLGDRGLAILKTQSGLLRLYLQGTEITDEGLAELHELRELRYVDIRGTRVSLQGVRALEAALPNTRVMTDRR